MDNELFVFNTSGFNEALKKCTECLRFLPIACFGKDSGANYLRGKCRTCEKNNAIATNRLRKQFPPPDSTKYSCPLCNITAEELVENGYKVKWCLDHNHATGEFRGYICNMCNTGISNLKENANVLQRAAEYVGRGAVDHYIKSKVDDSVRKDAILADTQLPGLPCTTK